MGRGENGLCLRCRARRVIGSASRLFSTASIYFACFLASQSASIRGTKEHGVNGLRRVSGEKDAGEGGRLGGVPVFQTNMVTVGRENKLNELRN